MVRFCVRVRAIVRFFVRVRVKVKVTVEVCVRGLNLTGLKFTYLLVLGLGLMLGVRLWLC